jgi:hypothetical protein
VGSMGVGSIGVFITHRVQQSCTPAYIHGEIVLTFY